MANPLIIAHRGASFRAPENTLSAVWEAWEQGADAVEIDVRVSSDGKIMVIHDGNTLRTSGVSMNVAENDRQRLQTLDVGAFKGTQWAGERIPLLGDVLQTIPKGKFLFVEIKCGLEIIPALKQISFEPYNVKFISFDLQVLAALRPVYRQSEMFLLFDGDQQPVNLERLLHTVEENGLDGLDVNASFPLDAAMMAEIRRRGKKIYFWTVDDSERARYLWRLGVDGITTNRPGWLKRQLAAHRPDGEEKS